MSIYLFFLFISVYGVIQKLVMLFSSVNIYQINNSLKISYQLFLQHRIYTIQLMQVKDVKEEDKQYQIKGNLLLESSQISLTIFATIIIVRALFCFHFAINYLDPTEYWNAIQPAHKFAYGFGMLQMEYSVQIPIRTYFFPCLVSLPYQIIYALGLDNTWLNEYAPRFYQFFVAIIFDYFLIKINAIYNPNSTKTLLLLTYTTYIGFYDMSIVYNNSTQAMFHIVAFYLWLRQKQNKYYDLLSRFLVIIGFLARSTIILVWAFIWPYQLLIMKGKIKDRVLFILKNILTLLLMPIGSILFTYFYEGRLFFTQYYFFQINFIYNLGLVFGVYSVFNYVPQILKQATVIHVLLFVYGLYCIFKSRALTGYNKIKQLALITFVYPIIILSTQPHKQARFLIVFLPTLLIVMTKGYLNTKKPIKIFLMMLAISQNLYKLRRSRIYNKFTGPLIKLKQDPSVRSLLLYAQPLGVAAYSLIHKNIQVSYQNVNPIDYQDDRSIYFWEKNVETYKMYLSQFDEPPSHILSLKYPSFKLVDPRYETIFDDAIHSTIYKLKQ